MIYLDNAATTQILPEVLDAMMPYLKEEYGNAGVLYGLGRRSAKAIAEARQQVASLIECEPEQIIFTSGGSEANNLVFTGLRPYLLANGKTHIIASAVEHESVIKSIKSICNPLCLNTENVIKSDFGATFLGVNQNCEVSVADLAGSIIPQTGLVSVMYVNNETGAINPIHKFGKLCHDRGVLFHTDCVQATGFQDISVGDIDCDFLSISSHKINAPKGVGALYAKDTSILSPIIHGGTTQEFGLRGGTENVAGIVGFGKACEISKKNLKANREKANNLRILFEKALISHLYNAGIIDIFHINSKSDYSKISNIRFNGIDGQTLLLLLDTKQIYVSAGSACRSYEDKPSYVLLAMGMSDNDARNSIRVSFSHTQDEAQVLQAAKVIAKCVKTLKEQSYVFN